MTGELAASAIKALEMLRDMAHEDGLVEPFDGKVDCVYADYSEKGIRVGDREVDFIASTPDIDGDGDIVEQDFLFERFLKNPVILFGHQSRALPIGQALNPRVEGGVLRMTVRFASKAANPVAERVFLLVQEKVLRAMSIGFRPQEIRREMRDDKEVFVLSKNNLIESSVVTIPSNENALAEMKSKALAAYKSPLTPPSEQEPTTDGGGDSKMDETEAKALNDKVAELEADNAKLEASNKALTEESAVHVKRYEALEELYNTEKSKANDADLAVVEKDIDALIGKKISADEKPNLMKLAAVNRELFDSTMVGLGNRPDMQLREQSVLPDAGLPPSTNTDDKEKASGADLHSMTSGRAGLTS